MATFTNQARLVYNAQTTNSNIAVGTLIEAANATKTPVLDTYRPGDTITYVINATNTTASPLTGLTLTDDLGGYDFGTRTLYPLTYVPGSLTYFINGVPQPAPTITPGDELIVTGLSIPANGGITLIYQATVNDFAPLDTTSTIVNTAAFTSPELAAPIEATATIRTLDAPTLTISKSISPAVVNENGRVTYTFVIQNLGNTPVTLADDIRLTDTFNPRLTDLVVTLDGTPWTENTQYTYSAAGEFANAANTISVPAATYYQDPDTGAQQIIPGSTILTVTGTI